eukprot:15480463-Alexandrium_andersonii.AAC.1
MAPSAPSTCTEGHEHVTAHEWTPCARTHAMRFHCTNTPSTGNTSRLDVVGDFNCHMGEIGGMASYWQNNSI